jgi:hypothetical protein
MMAMVSAPENLALPLRDTLNKVTEALHDEDLLFLQSQAKIARGPREMLVSLKNIFRHAWMGKSIDVPELLLVLAVASRDRGLRPSFGGDFDQNPDPENSILAYVLDHVLSEGTRPDNSIVLENALRLVSNCVADTNCNRRLALQKNAIKKLLQLAKQGRSVDFVIPALYNLCVEYNDLDKTIEAEDSTKVKANAAQVELAHSDPEKGIILALFDMLSFISPDSDQRKPLLAGLIEMVSLTAPEDLLCIGITPEMEPEARRRAAHRAVLDLLGTSSIALASYDGDTAVSVCNALLNLLAVPVMKEVLVSQSMLHALANFYHTFSTHVHEILGDDDEEETLASLRQCEKGILKEFYVLSGLPEFTAAYTLDAGSPGSDFIQTCIERPRNPALWTYSPAPTDPSVAISYTVLANVTTSEDTAVKLVHTYRVHEPLQAILRDLDDADTIYPALGLLSRLSLPFSNKQELVNCGMLQALRRFFGTPGVESSIEWKPALQIEALTTLRRLISGQIGILSSLLQGADAGSYMRDLLNMFTTCKDSSTKIEIGRFCVEHFRTISSRDQTDPASRLSEQTIDRNNLAGPIAFLTCEGPSPGAKAEGWFGLGLMTFWDKTRAQVLEVMKTAKMVEEVGKVVDAVSSSERASADNLKLVLSQLDFNQSTTDVERDTKQAWTSAKQKLGLQDGAG